MNPRTEYYKLFYERTGREQKRDTKERGLQNNKNRFSFAFKHHILFIFSR